MSLTLDKKHILSKIDQTNFKKLGAKKVDFIGNLKFSATHSTGLRNPTLYEFYGSDKYGYTGNENLNPEKSETNELYIKYNILFLKII